MDLWLRWDKSREKPRSKANFSGFADYLHFLRWDSSLAAPSWQESSLSRFLAQLGQRLVLPPAEQPKIWDAASPSSKAWVGILKENRIFAAPPELVPQGFLPSRRMIPEPLLFLGKHLDPLDVRELIRDLHPFLGCWWLIFTTQISEKWRFRALKCGFYRKESKKKPENR